MNSQLNDGPWRASRPPLQPTKILPGTVPPGRGEREISLLAPPAPPKTRFCGRWLAVLLGSVGLSLGAFVALLLWEMRTSTLQARWLAPLAAELTWSVEEGPSPSLVFPEAGPYDLRLGYARLPEMVQGAGERGFGIVEQARFSPRLLTSVEEWGLFPIYPTKARAGLSVVDRRGESLFARPYPTRAYPSFESIPPVVWQTLLFIESRTFLDPDRPRMNPAVEWPRLVRSSVDLGLRFLGKEGSVAGASTLATQLEKFRHAPGGRTTSPRQKLTQMASASLRAYRSGPETLPARRRIVLDYLNSVPLAAQRGQGEVTGLGDGLHAWFGRDFVEANRRLAGIPANALAEHGSRLPDPQRVLPEGTLSAAALWMPPFSGGDEGLGDPFLPASLDGESAKRRPGRGEGNLQAQGAAYREVLSLLLAQRRPSFYLAQPEGGEALRLLTDRYLEVLRDGGVISRDLAGAARNAEAGVRTISRPEEEVSFVKRKGVDALRIQLLDALGVPGLYDLDRLDLTVETTLDGRAQRETTELLLRMANAKFVRERGFGGDRLLDRGDPAEVVYSVMLHERTERGNLVRIETDNVDTPFSVNESSLLELGSTAKLRTLATYLGAVRELHGRFSGLAPDSLAGLQLSPNAGLARWARDSFLQEPGIELPELLEASMDRTYSASPHERFETGGGSQTFSNFDDTYDGQAITVTEAFRQSVNLVFVRMMRDVVNHYTYRTPDSKAHVLAEADSPLRREYLEWFADREGIEFLDRFIPKFRGKGRSEILKALVRDRRLTPQRIAWAYRTAAPDPSREELEGLLREARPEAEYPEAVVQDLFRRADPAPHPLADLGYLASVHPLELWTARHLIEYPEATRAEILTSSAGARQDVYRWLFRTSRRSAQDRRIRSLLEVEAFSEIHAEWKRLGYPFENVVPSLGSAIGSSGDRPSALGELVGIILNDGIRLPTYRVEELHFAEGTPFETRMAREETVGERVMAPEVARVLRAAMVDVVENGTGRRMGSVLRRPDGTPLTVGGKTGTGENRHRVFGPGGTIVDSRSVNRTAAFVFFIEDRYHGVVTAYVPGAAADRFRFTSSLTTHLLRELAPVLEELARDGSGAAPVETTDRAGTLLVNPD